MFCKCLKGGGRFDNKKQLPERHVSLLNNSEGGIRQRLFIKEGGILTFLPPLCFYAERLSSLIEIHKGLTATPSFQTAFLYSVQLYSFKVPLFVNIYWKLKLFPLLSRIAFWLSWLRSKRDADTMEILHGNCGILCPVEVIPDHRNRQKIQSHCWKAISLNLSEISNFLSSIPGQLLAN